MYATVCMFNVMYVLQVTKYLINKIAIADLKHVQRNLKKYYRLRSGFMIGTIIISKLIRMTLFI